MALLPCFATLTPQAAAMKDAHVEILNVFKPSPPVPQLSITLSLISTFVEIFLIALAKPINSFEQIFFLLSNKRISFI